MKTPKTRPLILEHWSSKGQFYCHLLSPNGNILLVSEGYERMTGVTKVYYALKRTGAQIELRKHKPKACEQVRC